MHIKVNKTPEELLKTQDTNAYAWAIAFNKINPQIDIHVACTWFANAMMVMHDKHANKKEELIRKMESLLLLTDPAVFHIEMNETSIKQFNELERWKEEQKFK